jgi:hypothetical protein
VNNTIKQHTLAAGARKKVQTEVQQRVAFIQKGENELLDALDKDELRKYVAGMCDALISMFDLVRFVCLCDVMDACATVKTVSSRYFVDCMLACLFAYTYNTKFPKMREKGIKMGKMATKKAPNDAWKPG